MNAIENFNAKSMRELSEKKEGRKFPREPINEIIEWRIKLGAKLGNYESSFIREEHINYIREHQKEFEDLGFSVIFSSDYGLLEAIIRW